MRKAIIFVVIITFAMNIHFLIAFPNQSKDELYIQALSERDLQKKMEKLEEYYNKYGNRKRNLTPIFFITIIETSLQLKSYEKTEEYIEKARKYKKLDQKDKLKVKLAEASVMLYAKKDTDKAVSLADEIIAQAKKLKDIDQRDLNFEYIGPSTRLKIAALDSGSKDYETTKKALQASIDMYKNDGSQDSARFVFHFSKRLFSEFNKSQEAFDAMEIICQSPYVKEEYLEQLALWYGDEVKEDKALEKMTMAYNKTRNSKRAFYIGKWMYEKDVDKAINYLAEASVLSQDNFATNANEMLRRIYFEQKATDLTDEEKEQGLQKILDEAKKRLGL